MKKIALVYVKYTSLRGDGIINDTAKFLLEKIAEQENIRIETKDFGVMPPYKHFQRLYNFQEKLNLIFTCFEYKFLSGNSKSNLFVRNICFLLTVLYWLYLCKTDKYFKSYFDEITNGYDIVFFSGGGLFQQFYMSMWSGVLAIVLNCSKKNVPVYINAVGLEKSDLFLEHLLYKFIVNQKIIKFITVRENSEYMSELLKGSKTFNQVLDTGLWADECFDVKKEVSDLVGIGVIRPEIFRAMGYAVSDNMLLEFYMDLITELEKRNYKWQLFCNGGKDDYYFGKKIIDTLGKSEEYFAPFPKNSQELMNIIKKYEVVIAARMHAIIAATALNIPTVSLVWAKKSLHLAKNLKLGACITPDRFSCSSEIVDCMEKSLLDGVDKEHIEKLKNFSFAIMKSHFKELLC